jgi:hypothetical protein
MCDIESISGSQIGEINDSESDCITSDSEICYGYSTIPLHPILMRDKKIINKENNNTFIQTLESVNNSVCS